MVSRENSRVIDGMDSIIVNLVKQTMVVNLSKLADELLEYAQERHEFKNRTFNLEDSYGYAIYDDGKVVVKTLSSPKATKSKVINGTSYRGHSVASQFLDEYKPQNGISLVVVAGMYYAADLEDTFGLDVLTGSFNLAMSKVDSVFKEIPKSFISSK